MQKCTPYFTPHSPNTVIMVERGFFSLFHVLGRISFSGNSGDFYTYWWTAAFLKRLIYITVPTVETVTNPYSSKILWADIYDSKTWQLIRLNANTARRLTVSFIILIRSTRFQTKSFNTILSSLRGFFFSFFVPFFQKVLSEKHLVEFRPFKLTSAVRSQCGNYYCSDKTRWKSSSKALQLWLKEKKNFICSPGIPQTLS